MANRPDPELQRLLRSRITVLDGATGTELTRRGVSTALPLWSADALLNAPHTVEEIHRDHAAAGAQIIVANTFRTNARTLRAAGLLARGEELNVRALELARAGAVAHRGAPPFPLIAASVAPVEDCYHPERVPDFETLLREHWQMMSWLRAASPDLIWIETINTVREARAAATAARGAGFDFAVSFVTDAAGHLLSGESLDEALGAIDLLRPIAVGLNCIPPSGMDANLPILATWVDSRWKNRPRERPALAAYAHIGNPEPISGWDFSESMTPEQYAEHARRWIEQGAQIIGGCCGTTAGHIRAVTDCCAAAAVDRINAQ